MKLLDCTLRDGGYYVSWDFPRPLVLRYLKAMETANVDIVELGLRSFPGNAFAGAYAYTTDEHIRSLDVPESLQIAVMVDATTILSYNGSCSAALAKLFAPKEQSPVDIVRIAAHFKDVFLCGEMVAGLKALGYTVGFNLMQSGGRPDAELEKAAAEVSRWDAVDVLYFADSLGNMDTAEVTRIFKALQKGWHGPVGIHTHNNQGKGLENSLTAYRLGVKWLDATVLGMGRGAGNTATELLTLELGELGENYSSIHLWNLVLDDFTPLQVKHGWGAGLLYHFAATHGIHPSYVQNLLGDGRYSSEHIIQALFHLAPLGASSYNAALLNDGVSGVGKSAVNIDGSWDASGWCAGREVLIIGAGSSVSKYKDGIVKFIQKRDIVTLSLNIQTDIPEQAIDGFVAIDPMRLALEISDYAGKGKPLYTSINSLPPKLADQIGKLTVRDYGYNLAEGGFESGNNACKIPSLLSLAYSLALAQAGGAKRIWLVGFDGFKGGDKRQEEMISLFDVLKNADYGLEIICLTPTNYPVKQGSIYAPY